MATHSERNNPSDLIRTSKLYLFNKIKDLFTSSSVYTSSGHQRGNHQRNTKKNKRRCFYRKVSNALKSVKTSKARGSDSIAFIMLKTLGQMATPYQTDFLNQHISFRTFEKLDGTSLCCYRPTSLLSPVAKLMENSFFPRWWALAAC